MKPQVLFYQTAFLGDLLLSIPLLKRIRIKYPGSEILLVCRNGCSKIFLETGLVDHAMEINKSNPNSYKEVETHLLKITFQAVYCAHYSIRTNILMFKIKSSKKIGFSNFWNYFVFSKRINRNLNLPDVLRQLQLIENEDFEVQKSISEYLHQNLLSSLNLEDLPPTKNRKLIPPVSDMSLKLELQKHPSYSEILRKYSIDENTIFMAPGSVWNTKRWTESGFKQLCERFNKVALIGSPQEYELCANIAKGQSHVVNLAGVPDLFDLLILLTKAPLLVSNDSGSMHMGSVAGVPTVAIFGPTVLSLGYQPWQDNSIVVENKNLACRPCGKHGHQVCPLKHHNCMKSITSENVFSAIQKLL